MTNKQANRTTATLRSDKGIPGQTAVQQGQRDTYRRRKRPEG